jgi:hypothetical protein
MLRALPDAAQVASLIARACLEVQPGGQVAVPVTSAAQGHGFGQAVAA